MVFTILWLAPVRPNLSVNTDAPLAALRARRGSRVILYRWASDGPSAKTTPRKLPEPQLPREIIYTQDAPKPPPMYSQAVRAAGLVFVSGTGPYDPKFGAVIGTTIQEQTKQCLTNISAILAAAGSSLSKVVSATVLLVEEDDFKGMNEEWVKWFPAEPPARHAAKLPVRIPGMRVSIAAIAEA